MGLRGLHRSPAGTSCSLSQSWRQESSLPSPPLLIPSQPKVCSTADLRGNFPGQQDHQKQKHPWKTTSPGRILRGETLLLCSHLTPWKNQEKPSLFRVSQQVYLFSRGCLLLLTLVSSVQSQLVGFGSSTRGQAGWEEHSMFG